LQEVKDSRIQGFKDFKDSRTLRIQGFKGSRIQGFKDSRFEGIKAKVSRT
jgi:hypothetical protein